MILEKYSNLQSQLPYLPHLILLSTLILGMVIGLMISVLMPQSKSECKIEYISRDEILAFEKARIERTKEQKLFFGKARDAIGLIEKFAKLRGNQGSHVVFVKGSFVRGPGVSSISAEIHSEVVQSLREGAAKRSNKVIMMKIAMKIEMG